MALAVGLFITISCTMQSHLETPPFALLLLSLLVLLIAAKWVSYKNATKKPRPPSPPSLPLIIKFLGLGTVPHRYLLALSQRYGDIMLIRLGTNEPSIVVSSAELASEVLKTNDALFASRPGVRTLKALFGDRKDIVSSPYGEHWRRMKAICVRDLLSKKRVESFRKVREEEVELMAEEIRKSGSCVNLREMFTSLTNDLICRVAFGRKYRGNVDFNELASGLIEVVEGFYVGDVVSWLSWVDRVRGVHCKVDRLAKTFHVFIDRILEERSSSGTTTQEENQDFVDVLLQIQSQDSCTNQVLPTDSIKHILMDMFIAGTLTIRIVMEWMMAELIKNPIVMGKLYKEIVMFSGNKKVVTEEELKSMKYLKAVLKETLRMHTPIPFLFPHESTHDVEISGFHIDAGTQLVVNAWSICVDPRYWEEPAKFSPERFLESTRSFKGQDFEFIPFGSGRRMCPGSEFATTITELAIANLVLQFEWSLPNGEAKEGLDTSEAPSTIFIRKKKPLVVVASLRTHTVNIAD